MGTSAGSFPAADAAFVTPATVITKPIVLLGNGAPSHATGASAGAADVAVAGGDSSPAAAAEEQLMVLHACGCRFRIVERQVRGTACVCVSGAVCECVSA